MKRLLASSLIAVCGLLLSLIPASPGARAGSTDAGAWTVTAALNTTRHDHTATSSINVQRLSWFPAQAAMCLGVLNKQTITVSNPFLMKAEKVHEHDSQKPGFSK